MKKTLNNLTSILLIIGFTYGIFLLTIFILNELKIYGNILPAVGLIISSILYFKFLVPFIMNKIDKKIKSIV